MTRVEKLLGSQYAVNAGDDTAHDVVDGAGGNDYLSGIGGGGIMLYGRAGNDSLFAADTATGVAAHGGSGNDDLMVHDTCGDSGSDTGMGHSNREISRPASDE